MCPWPAISKGMHPVGQSHGQALGEGPWQPPTSHHEVAVAGHVPSPMLV